MIAALRLFGVLALFLLAGLLLATVVGGALAGTASLLSSADSWGDYATLAGVAVFAAVHVAALWIAFDEIDRLRIEWRLFTVYIPRRLVPLLRAHETQMPRPSLGRLAWIIALLAAAATSLLRALYGALTEASLAVGGDKSALAILVTLGGAAVWFLALRGIERKRRAWGIFVRPLDTTITGAP